MKKFLIILCLRPSIIINAQVIDYNNFNKGIMNEVMFNKLNEYTKSTSGNSLIRSTIAQTEIYRYIRKNNDKLLLDSLSSKINTEILKKYDTQSFLSIGILDSISCIGITTYQEIADRCIADWENSPSDMFFLVGWGTVVGVSNYYKKETKTIFISFVHLSE